MCRNRLDDKSRLHLSRKSGHPDQKDTVSDLPETVDEFAEILVTRQKQTAFRSSFCEKCVVGNGRIAFGRIGYVVARAAQRVYDLPVNAFVREEIQAAFGSSG